MLEIMGALFRGATSYPSRGSYRKIDTIGNIKTDVIIEETRMIVSFVSEDDFNEQNIKKITGASYHESVPFPFYYSPPFLDNLRDLIQSHLASKGGRPTLMGKPVVRKVRFSEEG
jgi:hypothetical protein